MISLGSNFGMAEVYFHREATMSILFIFNLEGFELTNCEILIDLTAVNL